MLYLEEEMRNLDVDETEEFCRLESSEKNDRYPRKWMVAADGETGRGYDKHCSLCVKYERSVMSAQMWEVSLLGVGTVLRLERDAWSMGK